jgi:hypothetical protein
VLLRLQPDARWPVLLAAVRDEFLGRPWDAPAGYWPGLFGGRDRVAGGTWLAVDPVAPALAALLNGARLPVPPEGVRPSRGTLALDALSPGDLGPGDVSSYDGFHLLKVTLGTAEVWSWDGADLSHRTLGPGDHVLVNAGPDAVDPVVDTGRALLADLGAPGGEDLTGATRDAWGAWTALLEGDPVDEPGRLLVRRDFDGRTYGSSSVALVALGPSGARYDFSPVPASGATWARILPT